MSSSAPAAWRARTVAIDDPGPLARYLSAPSDVAWLRRGDGVVGLGVAASCEPDGIEGGAAWWAATAASIEHETELPGAWGVGPLAFGSFTFDPSTTRHRPVMVVPRVILGRRDGRSWLTVVGPEAASPVPAPPAPPPGAVVLRPEGLDGAEWTRRVALLVERLNDPGDIVEKVVLARALRARAERPIEARWLVARLASSYPTCWTFHVDRLVGASPEMLLRVERGLATSRVLAGTIRRSDPSQDAALAEALSGSGKDLEEHEFAVASVAEALRPYCSGMNVPDVPFVLQLPNVMHLASDITGVMAESVSSLLLAGRLHPSAAVCGTPTEAARAAIGKLEGLDRARYAGPVGWTDTRGDGEWAIALRCGLIDETDPREITLYAGGGIVSRSRPEEELAETRAKLRPMLDALSAGDERSSSS